MNWPAIEGIEEARSSDICGRNINLFHRLILRFSKSAPKESQKILIQLQENNSRAAMESLHKLRGMAGNMAAIEVYNTASQFEAALREGQKDISIIQAEFEAALQKLLIAINKWLLQQDFSKKPSNYKDLTAEELQVLNVKLIELETLLSKNMARACHSSRAIMLLLKDTLYADIFEPVHQLVESYDFAESLEKLRDLRLHEPFIS